jgi:hypothetical protein
MSKSEESEEPLTQREFIEGCLGCLNIGCLPFVVAILIFIVTLFN